MAKVHDKVNATEFSVETGLDDAGIRRAGQLALEAGKRFMTKATLMERPPGEGLRRFHFSPHDHHQDDTRMIPRVSSWASNAT